MKLLFGFLFLIMLSCGNSEPKKFDSFKAEIDSLNRVINDKPNDDSAFFHRGLAYYKQKNYEMALADFDKAIEFNENFGRAILYRARASEKTGDLEWAVQDYSNLIHCCPEYEILAIRERGHVYFKAGDLETALKEYQSLIDSNPDDTSAFYFRGLCKLSKAESDINFVSRMTNFESAVKDFSVTISKDSLYSDAFWARAKALENLRYTDQALMDFNRAIRINPKKSMYYVDRANSLRMNEINGSSRHEKALEDYHKALELDSTNVYAYSNRGFLKASLNDNTGACEDFKKAKALKHPVDEELKKYCK